jgi:uncharacterized protein YciI
MKKHFFLKLIAPRPDFPMTMSDGEKALMQQHVGHWMKFVHAGNVIVFGPVLDPAGAFGMGVVSFESEDEAARLCNEDPVIKANIGFKYERFVMPQLITK